MALLYCSTDQQRKKVDHTILHVNIDETDHFYATDNTIIFYVKDNMICVVMGNIYSPNIWCVSMRKQVTHFAANPEVC